jgi:hypothetical protein
MFRAGGLSVDLTHHVVHALGSRMWGFTQEVFPTPPPPADPDERAAMFQQVAGRYPHIVEIATVGSHDEAAAPGQGCGDPFAFAVDVLLDGFERLHERGWNSAESRRGKRALG